MKDLAIITVPYITNEVLYNMARYTYRDLPEDIHKIAVVNYTNENGKQLIEKYNDTIIYNDENCLAKAWNKGIREGIKQGFNYFFICNLDIFLKEKSIENLYEYHKKVYKECGVTSIKVDNCYHFFKQDLDTPENYKEEPILYNNHAFSAFMLDVDTFNNIGEFDEQFKPCYYEDTDYYIRLYKKGYIPKLTTSGLFWHLKTELMRGPTEDEKITIWDLDKKENYKKTEQVFIKKWNCESGEIPKFLKEHQK